MWLVHFQSETGFDFYTCDSSELEFIIHDRHGSQQILALLYEEEAILLAAIGLAKKKTHWQSRNSSACETFSFRIFLLSAIVMRSV